MAGLVALTGLAHTRAARPVLALLGAHVGCPVLDASAAEMDSSRARGFVPLRGEKLAPSRPALDFTLGRSTATDVRAWGDARGARCEVELAKTALHCRDGRDERAAAPSEDEDAYFRFDARGLLVGVDVIRSAGTAESAAGSFDAARTRLLAALGPATSTDDAPTVGYLATGALHRAGVAYRFRDYAADVSETSLGVRGVVVREQYRALD